MDAAEQTRWHGWSLGSSQLSIAPSPDNARAIALILTVEDTHQVVAEFFNDYGAADTMAWLDGAFQVAAQANSELVRRVEALGG